MSGRILLNSDYKENEVNFSESSRLSYFNACIRNAKKEALKVSNLNLNGLTIDSNYHLIICPSFPLSDNDYAGAFIKTRVAGYLDNYSLKIIVFIFNNQETRIHSKDNFIAIEGSLSDLKKLSSLSFISISVHHLNYLIFEALKYFIDFSSNKIILYHHGFESIHYSRNTTKEKFLKDPDYFVKRHFLKSYFWNQIIRKYPGRFQHVFVSEFLRKCFFEDNNISYKINSQIIHNYIDTKVFQYVERANFSGRFLTIRNFDNDLQCRDEILESLKLLLKRFPSLIKCLTFVGQGSDFFKDQFNVPVKIINTFLNHKDIHTLHLENDFFFIPTKSDTHGISRDEARSSGMIAITNATHAIPEFCNTNNSILLSSLEPEKMSTEIANAMNQRNLQEISKNGSKEVHNRMGEQNTLSREVDLMLN